MKTHAEEQKYPVASGYCDFLLETLEYNPGMKAEEAKKLWEEANKPKSMEFATVIPDECW